MNHSDFHMQTLPDRNRSKGFRQPQYPYSLYTPAPCPLYTLIWRYAYECSCLIQRTTPSHYNLDLKDTIKTIEALQNFYELTLNMKM